MLSQISLILLWYAPAAAFALITPITVMYFQLSSYQFRGFLAAVKRQRRRVWLPGIILSAVSFLICFLSDLLYRQGGHGRFCTLLGAAIIVLTGRIIGKKVYLSREGKSKLNFTARIAFLCGACGFAFCGVYLVRKCAPLLGLNAIIVFLCLYGYLLRLLSFGQ